VSSHRCILDMTLAFMLLDPESIMNQDPHVSAAVMFGHGKFQAGILIEPTKEEQFDPSDEEKLAEFRNKIWYIHFRVYQS